MNKIQVLFDELIKKYNLRAITIEGETWYAMNDLPLGRKAINKAVSRLKDTHEEYIKSNTKVITISMVTLSHLKNFDSIANRGEMFYNFKMVNYLIMNSRLGAEYKIELIEILDKIRQDGFYVDDNITSEQLDKLQQKVDKLKDKLYYERTRTGLGATQIVNYINVYNLLPSTLFRFMDEYLHLGTYKVVNKNRRFKPNENFNKCSKKGCANIGINNQVIFHEEFANIINNSNKSLIILGELNKEELAIRDKGIENKNN